MTEEAFSFYFCVFVFLMQTNEDKINLKISPLPLLISSSCWWITEADALTGGTSNGGEAPCLALIKPASPIPFPLPVSSPTPPFWLESVWQWCISLCRTGQSGWQETPQIPGGCWNGALTGKDTPLKKKKRSSKKKINVSSPCGQRGMLQNAHNSVNFSFQKKLFFFCLCFNCFASALVFLPLCL